MKAMIIRDEKLVLSEVSYPEMKPDELIIKIHAIGMNRADLMQKQGSYPPPPGWPEWPGLEVAGEVCGLSAGAAAKCSFKVGDKVCALLGGGGYAEYVAVPYGNVMRLPKGFSYEQGACIPEVYATAYLNLMYEAKLREGETVCVFAGASGVGIAVTQIAKAFGAKVIATVRSDEKAAIIKKFGADLIVNTKTQDIASVFEENPVDVVIDCVGGPAMGKCFAAMNRFGRWVMIATLGGDMTEIDLKTVYKKRLRLIGSTLRSRTNEEKNAILTELQERLYPYFENGTILPEIYRTFPLEEAEEAGNVMAANQNSGKIILTVG